MAVAYSEIMGRIFDVWETRVTWYYGDLFLTAQSGCEFIRGDGQTMLDQSDHPEFWGNVREDVLMRLDPVIVHTETLPAELPSPVYQSLVHLLLEHHRPDIFAEEGTAQGRVLLEGRAPL